MYTQLFDFSTDVSRVFHMKEGLTLLDFGDESSDTLKHLMLRCLICPLYLRSADGRTNMKSILLYSCLCFLRHTPTAGAHRVV